MKKANAFSLLLSGLLGACLLSGQPPAPGDLRRFFLQRAPETPTAWEHWLRERPPALALAREEPPDFSANLLNTVPPPPEGDPFTDNLTIYREGHYQLGLSALRGFNLRNVPRNVPELLRFLRLLRLRTLFDLPRWIQPESNALRLQNVAGLSFYFYF